MPCHITNKYTAVILLYTSLVKAKERVDESKVVFLSLLFYGSDQN